MRGDVNDGADPLLEAGQEAALGGAWNAEPLNG